MKLTLKQLRLNAIKLVRIGCFRKEKCPCCGNFHTRERMWRVYRYGINAIRVPWYYCQECMPTKEAVLNEIDTDGIPFGIFGVDSFHSFKKKDSTRLNARFSEFLDPVKPPIENKV